MSYNPTQNQQATTAQSTVDVGLQSFMRSVYNTMSFGLVVTGLMAFGIANVPALAQAIFGTPLFYVAAFAPLAFLWFGFTPARIARMSPEKVKFLFITFSALMGVSMASIFLAYSAESIARVFFITAATFAATSLYGYTTKRDLASMGSFLFMGVIGIFFAMIVNMFLHSATVQFVVSVIGVIVFTGLTAWDTQRLKETYAYGSAMADANAKLATMGALSLYLNFINLFQFLLSFMGNRN